MTRRLPNSHGLLLAGAMAATILVGTTLLDRAHGGTSSPLPVRARAATQPAVTPVPAVDIPSGAGKLVVLREPIVFRDATVGRAAPHLNVDAGILVDIDTGQILWSRNPHVAHAPASTTKILSALVALENFDPGRLVTVTPDALNQQPDETVMGLKAGEQLTVREMLTGMMLLSGNDAATSMAVDTVGMTDFVGTMNAQVAALGLHDSHFTTPVGLDDPGQKASPYDLAAIASAAYRHQPLFREIIDTQSATLPASALHQKYDLTNLNQLLQLYPRAVGVKPGFTGDAGPCLVAMAVRDGHRLVSVMLGGHKVFADSRTLLDWGFQQEGMVTELPTPAPLDPATTPVPAA
jgi:D-alanyl-D-alanine carboxypeptidase (penicillin-binding protein 5/6)